MHGKILVVEDDSAVRQMMRDVLEMEGYEVVTAKEGGEGIEQLKTFPLPEVILLDLMMPGVNGWKFLDYLKENPSLAKIPVVVCSACNETAKTIKPSAIVEKPVKLNILLDTIHGLSA